MGWSVAYFAMAKALAEAGADISIAARSVKENEVAEKQITDLYSRNCMSTGTIL